MSEVVAARKRRASVALAFSTLAAPRCPAPAHVDRPTRLRASVALRPAAREDRARHSSAFVLLALELPLLSASAHAALPGRLADGQLAGSWKLTVNITHLGDLLIT